MPLPDFEDISEGSFPFSDAPGELLLPTCDFPVGLPLSSGLDDCPPKGPGDLPPTEDTPCDVPLPSSSGDFRLSADAGGLSLLNGSGDFSLPEWAGNLPGDHLP